MGSTISVHIFIDQRGKAKLILCKIIAVIDAYDNNFIVFLLEENKKLEVASQYLNQGRLLEAFYEVMETNIINEIAGPLTRGQKAMLTNYVQHRFQADTVWGVQQVGDMMTFNSDGSINQVQLKAFVEGTTEANFGGLPSVIT